MHIIQFQEDNKILTGVTTRSSPDSVLHLKSEKSFYDLALLSMEMNVSLTQLIADEISDKNSSYSTLLKERRLLIPLMHKDPYHCIVTGVGLTHINSTLLRQNMEVDSANLTDAEKIYNLGCNGGHPKEGEHGVCPEWFYKGNGLSLKSTGSNLIVPSYSECAGDEAEIVAVYIIGQDKLPHRIGFSLGNEFSDHGLEQQNHYFLAQSKLLTCSVGPELFIGDFPKIIDGAINIYDSSDTLKWNSTFKTGFDRMVHSLQNIEHHVFKHSLFNQPGDIHYLYLGADTVSYRDQIKLHDGDKIEISADLFTQPLINILKVSTEDNY